MPSATSPPLPTGADRHTREESAPWLNIDENPDTAAAYGVMSIPTMSVFVGGRVAKTIVGAKPKAAIVRELRDLLNV